MAEAYRCGWSRIGDRASVRAATRVNAEQASQRTMCRPTRQRYRGRLIQLGEMSDDDAQPLHRSSLAAPCRLAKSLNLLNPRLG
jgi:hypothetical protein